MDSSELVYRCVGLMGTSVSAWRRRLLEGGFSSRESRIGSLSESFSSVGTTFGEIEVSTRFELGVSGEIEVCCTSFVSGEEIEVCCTRLLWGRGGGVWVVWHHLRMADLRARLGMRVEKSGVVPSGSWGVKLRFLQASTEERSKEWPEETMTGSDMREWETGQRNSSGGVWILGLVLVWKKIFFHFSFGVAAAVFIGSESFGVFLGDDGHFLWMVSFSDC